MVWPSASSIITTTRHAPAKIRPPVGRAIGYARLRIPVAILKSVSSVTGSRAADPIRSRFMDLSGVPRKYYVDWRGLYRIFNDAEYRFYRKLGSPPLETDTPFATNDTLPHEPPETYGGGTWFLAVSYFNGIVDSGFLPLGPFGENYLRVDISGGVEFSPPPQPPAEWSLELRDDLIIRINASYNETGTFRATEWAMTYTIDGSVPGEPPAIAPTETVVMLSTGLEVLQHDLPTQPSATILNLRLQTRRFDGGTWLYSEGSIVQSAMFDSFGGVPPSGPGPDAVLDATTWPGQLPKGF